MPEYHNLTEDELLHIAGERDQLTADARSQLDAELVRRRISEAEILSYGVEFKAADEAERARAKRMISGSSFDRSGIGTRFFGKSNLQRDPSGSFEEYDSTKWFVFLWFPVFPIGTFRVRRTISYLLGIPFKSYPEALERHTRDWEQILWTWIIAMSLLFAFIVVITQCSRFLPLERLSSR